jgi:pSer/pThr/pTyr-binding forkhead associated (FHA) protein
VPERNDGAKRSTARGASFLRIFVLALSDAASQAVELNPGRPVLVGRGPGTALVLEDPRVAARHLTLTARADAVVVEELRGASGTQLNDVQVSGQALARTGDEIRIGDARLVVAFENDAPAPLRPRLATHDELAARLEDELARARPGRPVGLGLVGLPPLNASARQALVRRLIEGTQKLGATACWGEFSADVLAVIVPDLEAAALDAVLAKLSSLAGQRARVASVVSRVDGLHPEALWERALERLHAVVEVEPVVVDPVMVRLREAVERLARKPVAVAFVGPQGSGRSFLARALSAAANAAVVEAQGGHLPSVAALLEAREGSVLLVRDADALDPAKVAEVIDRARGKSFVALTSQTMQPLKHVLKVPALADRPSEVLPLAESFLASERRLLNRPRLALGADARNVLSRYRWPGNVRELRNVMARAARSAVRDELGRDALPARLSTEAPEESLRGALKAAERELLLEALARTRWNVTAAASRLGIPRRTVVYRMARLGLKRPAR